MMHSASNPSVGGRHDDRRNVEHGRVVGVYDRPERVPAKVKALWFAALLLVALVLLLIAIRL
jgi:hypothetical protein